MRKENELLLVNAVIPKIQLKAGVINELDKSCQIKVDDSVLSIRTIIMLCLKYIKDENWKQKDSEQTFCIFDFEKMIQKFLQTNNQNNICIGLVGILAYADL